MAEHQAEAADHVGDRVFQAKGDGETADAECEIQTDRAGRDVFDIHAGVFAQTHNRAFAELLFDLTERSGKCFLLISRRSDRFQLLFGSHDSISS